MKFPILETIFVLHFLNSDWHAMLMCNAEIWILNFEFIVAGSRLGELGIWNRKRFKPINF